MGGRVGVTPGRLRPSKSTPELERIRAGRSGGTLWDVTHRDSGRGGRSVATRMSGYQNYGTQPSTVGAAADFEWYRIRAPGPLGQAGSSRAATARLVTKARARPRPSRPAAVRPDDGFLTILLGHWTVRVP